jgi:hypothetical protein
MKKLISSVLVLCVFAFAKAQDRILTKTATTEFIGSVATFEPIEAINKSTTVVLDAKGNLAALVLIKGFKFPIALMQEHFNENYIESDRYPKATLKGSLSNYKEVINGYKGTFTFNGTLELHGVTRNITFPVTLQSNKDGLTINSKFTLNPADFKIDIPSVVRKKIANEIQVTVLGKLK